MIKIDLQLFGGRGGGTGYGGGPATGGKSGTVRITGGTTADGTQKVTSYTGGDGLVKEISFGSNNRSDKGYIGKDGYDVYTTLGRHAGNIRYGGGTGELVVAIKLNTPKGTSDKQISYAQSVASRRVSSALSAAGGRVVTGKMPVQQIVTDIGRMPAMSAREILDKWR